MNNPLDQKSYLLNKILLNLPMRIFFIDQENNIQFANKLFAEFFGSTTNEVIGKKMELLFDFHFVEKFNRIKQNLIEIRNEINFEFEMEKDDKRLSFEMNVRSLIDDKDGFYGIIGIVNDLSKKHFLDEKLVENEYMESLSFLTGSFAHDINNIMRNIRSLTNLLVNQENSDLKHYYLKIINDSISKASTLTEKILKIGKNDKIANDSINLNLVVNEVVNLLELSTEKNIKFDLIFSSNLLTFIGEYGQIFRMIMNLVINGIEAIDKKGTITISTYNIKEINLTTKLLENFVCLTITDSGHGIDNALQQKIFEPFYTTKHRSTEFLNTGLGLSIVYKVVKFHNAKIALESEIGKGTKFTIKFPIIR